MNRCFLCKSGDFNELKYGKVLEKGNIRVHYFCLLLSSNLVQRGSDRQDFLGFLIQDVVSEEKRISNLKCYYCHKESAGIGCCNKSCRITFHLKCGIENGAENRFCGTFQSFCHKHISSGYVKKLVNHVCDICYDNLDTTLPCTMQLIAPCCQNGWFHKYCLQKFANESGYFFKCPLCNNTDTFRRVLPKRGIFVPDQDASWEIEPNAFEELLERPNKCNAKICLSEKGREYCVKKSKKFDMIICRICGSQAVHLFCNNSKNKFVCSDCKISLKTIHKRNPKISISSSTESDNENGKIDVTNYTDSECKKSNDDISKSDKEIEKTPVKPKETILTSSDSEDCYLIAYKSSAKRKISSDESSNVNIRTTRMVEKRKMINALLPSTDGKEKYQDSDDYLVLKSRVVKRRRLLSSTSSSSKPLAELSYSNTRSQTARTDALLKNTMSTQTNNTYWMRRTRRDNSTSSNSSSNIELYQNNLNLQEKNARCKKTPINQRYKSKCSTLNLGASCSLNQSKSYNMIDCNQSSTTLSLSSSDSGLSANNSSDTSNRRRSNRKTVNSPLLPKTRRTRIRYESIKLTRSAFY